MRGVVVLHGGSAPTALGDTWEWNGSTWLARPITAGPMSTASGSMTFDFRRNLVVFCDRENFPMGIHNGYSISRFWDWDGATWTRQWVPGSFAPSMNAPRTGFAFDPRVQRCVLHEEYTDLVHEYGAVQALPTVTMLGPGCGPYVHSSLTMYPQAAYLDTNIQVSVNASGSGVVGSCLLAGRSNTAWNGVPLPLDLTPFGAPSCSLRIAPETSSWLDAWTPGNVYWWRLPNAPSLAGTRISLQGAILAPTANAAGLLLTHGIEVTVGLR